MAATTVKISEEMNRKLDRLQARLLLRIGRKLSKQEILEKLIRLGLTDEETLLRHETRIEYPLSGRARKKVLRHVRDWGVATREEEIDRVLYGGGD